MKTFKTLLQNACEDYLISLDHKPTIEDIKGMCETEVSEVIWKAFNNLNEYKARKPQPNIDLDRALTHISMIAKSFIGKPVGSIINAIKALIKTSSHYGITFAYATKDNGFAQELMHTYEDTSPIIAVSVTKK